LVEKVAAARFVVAISRFCRAQLACTAGLSVWSKLHIVRCGVDTREFDVSGESFEGNSTFVCVGRLSRHKAQALIVEATSRVAVKYPQVKVLLIGDGENRDQIEGAIRRYGMQKHVEIMGWRNNTEVRQTLGGARALLLPSFAEGLPVVIMEALALGRPVITTFVAGIPELIDQDCGWIIPAGSVDDIVQAMTAALETPPSKLAEMGQEGRRRVMEAHDVHHNAAALRKLFAQVAAAN
jgi:glycosyltransferase involved in cell wall biosynthesis